MGCAGFFMDFLLISYTVIWCFRLNNSLRVYLALITFYPLRSAMQALFLMGRPKNFLWFDPHIISLTVPYHDTNDFYWSGHVGACAIIAAEWWILGWKKMMCVALFIGLNELMVLNITRAHYFIDFVTGVIFALFMLRQGEWLA